MLHREMQAAEIAVFVASFSDAGVGARAAVIDALGKVDTAVFWEVCLGLLLVVLLFTFSRSESPLPKAFTGADAFNPLTQALDGARCGRQAPQRV